ncbi:hypothetical protein J2S66_001934 [Saccharothrix longispora]|uniref:Uncharacterized protein n=2 Tax=Saccharothrix longispora TaxID=33920 RepID=A0ABU1PSC8_9PSEU|nr:hypothetical protein [Saccharothrix longispora]
MTGGRRGFYPVAGVHGGPAPRQAAFVTGVGEDGAERGGELAGPVAGEEPELIDAFAEGMSRLRARHVFQGPSGLVVVLRMWA